MQQSILSSTLLGWALHAQPNLRIMNGDTLKIRVIGVIRDSDSSKVIGVENPPTR